MKEQLIFPNNQEKANGREVKFELREAEPDEFVRQRDQLKPYLLPFLDLYSEEDYKKMETKLFLSDDKLAGFGINPDGTLISVFSLEKGRGQDLVREAVGRGARSLGCLGNKLRELYGGGGFRVKNDEPWNEAFAPRNWCYERFGTPNYYEMER